MTTAEAASSSSFLPPAPPAGPTEKREQATEIVRALRAAGHEAFFVGGGVRDLLRGVPPADYDIATSAEPEAVRALFPRTVPVGAAFGVILVLVGDERFEVSTFRREGPYSDGRRPDSVAFADARQDVLRRDFTVNGLLYDPLTGEVRDYVGARADLERQLIRAIGDPRARFLEDRLRLLRAVRFAANLGFAIEPLTFAALRELAPQIRSVSAERIREELTKLLTRPGARRGLELLEESGLLAVILPEVAALAGVAQPPEFHPEGDVLVHTALALELFEALPEARRTATLAFAVLLHDIGKPATFVLADRIRFNEHEKVGAELAARVCRRLRFSNAETERIVALVEGHMCLKDVRKMRPATLKRLLAREEIEELLELYRIDCRASHGKLGKYEFARKMQAELSQAELKPPRLLTGDDLRALGWPPGPSYRLMLRAVEDAQLDGEIATREAALALVRERFGAPGESPLPPGEGGAGGRG